MAVEGEAAVPDEAPRQAGRRPAPMADAHGAPVEALMAEALGLAALGRGQTSPNPMVGAVVVDPTGRIVGRGYHRRAGEAHAEVNALDEAGDRARGGLLVCTLEPCCHHGRTGPCAERVVRAGIQRVVIGTADPDPRVDGGGIRFLEAHGVRVETGVLDSEARRLNEAFFTYVERRRPFVIMKIALSRDGRIAAAPGARTALTSAEANARVDRLRSEVDAIAVGSGTILADDPRLTARSVTRTRPLTRVIFDRRLRTPPAAQMLGTLELGPVLVVTTERAAAAHDDRVRALQAAGAIVEAVSEPSAAAALARLARREIVSLLVEGGATLHDALWSDDLVDHVQIYRTPHDLGPDGVAWLDVEATLAPLERTCRTTLGPDELVEGDVHRTD